MFSSLPFQAIRRFYDTFHGHILDFSISVDISDEDLVGLLDHCELSYFKAITIRTCDMEIGDIDEFLPQLACFTGELTLSCEDYDEETSTNHYHLANKFLLSAPNIKKINVWTDNWYDAGWRQLLLHPKVIAKDCRMRDVTVDPDEMSASEVQTIIDILQSAQVSDFSIDYCRFTQSRVTFQCISILNSLSNTLMSLEIEHNKGLDVSLYRYTLWPECPFLTRLSINLEDEEQVTLADIFFCTVPSRA